MKMVTVQVKVIFANEGSALDAFIGIASQFIDDAGVVRSFAHDCEPGVVVTDVDVPYAYTGSTPEEKAASRAAVERYLGVPVPVYERNK